MGKIKNWVEIGPENQKIRYDYYTYYILIIYSKYIFKISYLNR